MHKQILSTIVLAGGLLGACSQEAPIRETNAPVSAKTAAILDSAAAAADAPAGAVYECPMQCEGSRSTQPGTCPVCRMTLERRT